MFTGIVQKIGKVSHLARISHKLSEKIEPLSIEIAPQIGEDSVHATRPHLSEEQNRSTECSSFPRICEKSGLEFKDSILRYAILLPADFLNGLERGASVSIDGICQTVILIDKDLIWFEAIGETLEKTTLKEMEIGTRVNVERAARFGDEIGGHLLSGHIYGTAPIISINQNIYMFRGSPEWMKYLFSKGYIALNGVSLTLVEVNQEKNYFTVHLIPETLTHTTFGQIKIGSFVNIEIDAMTQAAVDTIHRILLQT